MAGLDLQGWALAYSGAETIRSETLTRFAEKFAACGFRREAFFGCYGMAEATLFVTGGQRGRFPRVLSVDSAALQRHEVRPVVGDCEVHAIDVVSCGPAIDQDVEIVDPQTCRRCLPGQIGEIWVRGASVAQGYWNRAQETAATFAAHVADDGAGPYLRTGDLGFLDHGELFVTGRVKDLIIIRGRNFYPHDVESVVRSSHPALNAGIGAAFSIDVEGEERLIVLHEVHRHELRRLPHEEVLGAARMALMSELGLPLQDLVLLTHGSLPKTSSGKIRRRASREAYLEQALRGDMAACARLES
jgi:acyl-CoA synthetase (AMP-forming)/AMP-acid ligase II